MYETQADKRYAFDVSIWVNNTQQSAENLERRMPENLRAKIQTWTISTKMKRKNIRLVLSIFVVLFIYWMWTKVRVPRKRVDTKSQVCISLVHDELTPQLMKIMALKSWEELRQYRKQRGNEIQTNELSLLINRAYGLKFGYPVYVSDLKEYEGVHLQRHRSWKRLLWVANLLATHKECEWVAALDSFSYLWMDQHETKFHDWFSSTAINEATSTYDTFHHEKRLRFGYYDWKEQPYWFIIAASGVNQVPPYGDFQMPGDTNQDYVDDSIFLVRNNDKGRRFMEDWYYEPSDHPNGELHPIYEEFYHGASKERRILNRIIMPRQNRGVMIMSFKDMLLPRGRMTRKNILPEELKRDLTIAADTLFGLAAPEQ
jgi:hypothetical protein